LPVVEEKVSLVCVKKLFFGITLTFKYSPKEKRKDFYFLTEGVSCEARFSGMFALEKKKKFRRSF